MVRMNFSDRAILAIFARNRRELNIGMRKFLKVLREFKAGTLTSRGRKITNRRQAIAIAFSEARSAIKKQRRK